MFHVRQARVVLGYNTLWTIFTDLHIHAPLLKGDAPWVASGAMPRTRIEIPTAFLFHVTMIDIVFTGLRVHAPLLEGDNPWAASGALPQTRVRFPTTFFFHITFIDMAENDKASTTSWTTTLLTFRQ